MDQPTTTNEKITEWKYRMRLRIQSGRENNIVNHKVPHALDLAWEVPFRQVSTTLLSSMIDHTQSQESVERTLKAWGFDLSEVMEEYVDAKNPTKTLKRVSVPAFFQIFVPLVRAYVTIRLAKIMNDRKRIPFFKYEPALNNAVNRLRCEAITGRVEIMNQQYDYWSRVRQAVFQMLHYSQSFMFPIEEWHEESQEAPPPADMEPPDPRLRYNADKDRYETVTREGLRYHMPHPSRTFIDMAHAPSTFNTDTGCEFAGYWRVVRYRDLRNNPKFYNTDKINIGATEWWSSPFTQTFFSTVYNQCTIKPPVVTLSDTKDRETQLAENYYTQTMDDISVVYTEYFEKLVPSEWGFGDYDYPLWFRFVVAADDTILYAAPLPYSPVIYYGYDADDARSQNASLSLEILPFQDHFSNLMTQYLLTVKQNLANATLVDSDIMEEKAMKRIRNLGNRLYQGLNFFSFSGRKHRMAQHTTPNAFLSFKFPPLDSNSIVQAMKVVLDTLERVLAMSSQELAQAATHEQTREEVRHIAFSTSSRLQFTSTPVDLARDAMKRQIYLGLMAYGEEQFWTQVPLDKTMTRQDLMSLGFTFDENEVQVAKNRLLTVRVNKGALMLEAFSSNRDGEDRINNTEGGMAMLNVLQGLVASPLAPTIGPDQFIQLINLSAQLMGFPREFKLNNMGQQWDEPAGPNGETTQQMMLKLVQDMHDQIIKETQQGLKPVLDGLKKVTEENRSLGDQINTILKILEQERTGPNGSAIPRIPEVTR